MPDLLADLEWRGMVHQTTDPALGVRLREGALTLYAGFDPTADSLHVGSLLGLVTLARFQRAGHRPLAVAGGGTGFIGDPSGKSDERSLLTREQIAANCAGMQAVMSRVFANAGAGEICLVDNAAWLCEKPLVEFLRDVGKHFTVNAMMEKESVRARLEDRAHGISYTEFSYMLLQAYDFLHLHDTEGCRLQVGGSDQFGNITAGCELIRRVHAKRHGGGGAAPEVFGMTWPLLARSDGRKFGKTEEGTIWLSADRTSPYELHQYFYNTPDGDVSRFLRQFTDLPREEVLRLEEAAKMAPEERAAQRALARAVTTLVHGAEAASEAEAAASALFRGEASLASLPEATLLELVKEAPSATIPRSRLAGAGVPVLDLMAESGLWSSRGDARRAIAGHGASLNDTRLDDPAAQVTESALLHGRYLVLRKGRKSHFLFRVE